MKTQLRIATLLAIAACTLPTFAQNTGAATYTSKCQMCHGADGTGNTPAGKAMKAPSFLSPASIKESTADLIAIKRTVKGRCPPTLANSPTQRSRTSSLISVRCKNSRSIR